MVSSFRVPLVARQSRFHRDEPDGEQLAVWAPSEAVSASA
jgi:hypothetical protein